MINLNIGIELKFCGVDGHFAFKLKVSIGVSRQFDSG